MALFLLRKRKSQELADPIDPEPVTEPGHLLVKKVPGDQSVALVLDPGHLEPEIGSRPDQRTQPIDLGQGYVALRKDAGLVGVGEGRAVPLVGRDRGFGDQCDLVRRRPVALLSRPLQHEGNSLSGITRLVDDGRGRGHSLRQRGDPPTGGRDGSCSQGRSARGQVGRAVMESWWTSSPRKARSAFVPIASTVLVSSLVGGNGLGSRPSPIRAVEPKHGAQTDPSLGRPH